MSPPAHPTPCPAVRDLERRVTQIATPEIPERVAALEARAGRTDEDRRELRAEIREGFAAVNGRLDGLAATLASVQVEQAREAPTVAAEVAAVRSEARTMRAALVWGLTHLGGPLLAAALALLMAQASCSSSAASEPPPAAVHVTDLDAGGTHGR